MAALIAAVLNQPLRSLPVPLIAAVLNQTLRALSVPLIVAVLNQPLGAPGGGLNCCNIDLLDCKVRSLLLVGPVFLVFTMITSIMIGNN